MADGRLSTFHTQLIACLDWTACHLLKMQTCSGRNERMNEMRQREEMRNKKKSYEFSWKVSQVSMRVVSCEYRKKSRKKNRWIAGSFVHSRAHKRLWSQLRSTPQQVLLLVTYSSWYYSNWKVTSRRFFLSPALQSTPFQTNSIS